MKYFAVLALATAALASDVLDLTASNFKGIVDQENVMLVEFFAPWCGHCKSLAPKYEQAATALKDKVKLAKVDCTVESDLCQEFGVRGYPTLKVFRKGAPSDYQGARESDAIISYMTKQTLPALSVLEEANVNTFIDSDKVTVVGFFGSDSEEKAALQEVANALRDEYVFGTTDSETAAKEHGVEIPKLVLFKKFDEGKNVYEGDLKSTSDVTAFIKTNSVPLMDDIGPENYANYVDSGLPLALLFVGNEADRKKYGPEVERVAKRLKGKINFVYIDTNKYGGYANNVNLELVDNRGFALQEPQNNKKFPYSGELDYENIYNFCNEYVEGKLTPSLKSEEIPASQDEPVYVVVGKNFEDVVYQEKDVLIEFYAPWCGHCKKLAPIYDDLAKKLSDNKKIVIAKMDATENDVPDEKFQVSGFPTIKLVTADNKIIDYSGDRSLEDFMKFLKEKAVHGSDIQVSGASDADVEADFDHDEL